MQYVIGTLMSALAVLGLFLAAGAKDIVFAGFGFALFAFGVLYVFMLINTYAGHASADS